MPVCAASLRNLVRKAGEALSPFQTWACTSTRTSTWTWTKSLFPSAACLVKWYIS